MNQIFVIKVKGHKAKERNKWEYLTESSTIFSSPDINDSFFYKGSFAPLGAAKDIRTLKAAYPNYDFKVVEVEQITVIREKQC